MSYTNKYTQQTHLQSQLHAKEEKNQAASV